MLLRGRCGAVIRSEPARPAWGDASASRDRCDTPTRAAIENRPDERFPLTSTFKVPRRSGGLKLVDAGDQQLDRIIPIHRSRVEPTYSPMTKNHVGWE